MSGKENFADLMNRLHEPDVPSLADLLPTHPEPKSSAANPADAVTYKVRYQQFDLSKEDDVEELESIMTAVLERKKVLRQEKWSNDKDGFMTVTVCWMDIIPKVAPPAPKKDEEKTPSEEFGVYIPSIPAGSAPNDGVDEDEILKKQREYFLRMRDTPEKPDAH